MEEQLVVAARLHAQDEIRRFIPVFIEERILAWHQTHAQWEIRVHHGIAVRLPILVEIELAEDQFGARRHAGLERYIAHAPDARRTAPLGKLLLHAGQGHPRGIGFGEDAGEAAIRVTLHAMGRAGFIGADETQRRAGDINKVGRVGNDPERPVAHHRVDRIAIERAALRRRIEPPRNQRSGLVRFVAVDLAEFIQHLLPGGEAGIHAVRSRRVDRPDIVQREVSRRGVKMRVRVDQPGDNDFIGKTIVNDVIMPVEPGLDAVERSGRQDFSIHYRDRAGDRPPGIHRADATRSEDRDRRHPVLLIFLGEGACAGWSRQRHRLGAL